MQTASIEILEKTQLSTEQARGILRAMELECAALKDIFATKGDLHEAFHSMEIVIERARAELLAEIRSLEGRLTRWVFTCIMGQTALLVGAVYFAITHLRP
jgi:hypothetical protein